jgi:hypothetical protein
MRVFATDIHNVRCVPISASLPIFTEERCKKCLCVDKGRPVPKVLVLGASGRKVLEVRRLPLNQSQLHHFNGHSTVALLQ